MVRTTILGIAAVGTLLTQGWGCSTGQRGANPSRTTTMTPRVPIPTPTPMPGPTGGSSNVGCGLQLATSPLAFCETFDQPHSGGTRTGDLDPVLWGVSRIGKIDSGQGALNLISDTQMIACGATTTVGPPNAVRVCNGQVYESQNDNHGVVNIDLYPKQPFDFTGRTGTVGFDVSADSEGIHGAWPEFIITDKPVPGARSDISNTGGTSGNNDVLPPAAANEIGVNFDGGCAKTTDTTGVAKIYVTRNNAFIEVPVNQTDCVKKGSPTAMNHVEVRVNQARIEIWMSDGGSRTLKMVASADNLNLSFTKGLVWMTDAHYNADKFPNPNGQRVHTFAWDNLAFDGPKTYRDLGYDVPEANERNGAATSLGYSVGSPKTLNVAGNVTWGPNTTGAQIVFNYWVSGTAVPSVSLNGNEFIDTPNPFAADGLSFMWRSISIPIPSLSQVHSGANSITFKSTDGSTVVANISLIMVHGAEVP